MSTNVRAVTPSNAVDEDANLYLSKFNPVPAPTSRTLPLTNTIQNKILPILKYNYKYKYKN